MTGEAEVILESPEIAVFQGAERLWRFRPRVIVRRPAAIGLRWTFRDWSANSLMTGSWEDAGLRLKAQALATQWRPFRVARIVDESTVIRSFHLEPADGAGVTPHRAGQHLPIRLRVPGEAKPILRTYTVSTAPSDPGYRISVKRHGLASAHLHDRIAVGDIIEARAPAGDFTIDAAERRPAVLIAAGVGITPMLAMLRHIVFEGLRTRRVRPTVIIQAARSRNDRGFDAEIAALVARADGKVRRVRTLDDVADGAVAGVDFEAAGRVDMALLRQVLGFDDHDFYLCGPPPFMQTLYDGLRGLNIADNRIHSEAFGPASMRRRVDPAAAPAALVATVAVPVAFAASAKEARWLPESGSLLDLAEARGLAPDFSCRGGSCGTCRTRIIEGAVAYATPPSARVEADEALICCAMPADTASGGGARLILDL
jgi:ferredoxin-NADP reductase